MLDRIKSLFFATFLEGIRSRMVYGIFLLALLICGMTFVVSDFFMRDISKVATDLSLGGMSIAGALLVFFASINLMAKDIEKKTICLILSRPFSRFEYLVGKFLGLLSISFVSLLVVFIISIGCMALIKLANPTYFQEFSWTIYLIAGFFIFLQVAVLNSVIVFFSSISTSSFLTLVCSFSFYLVGRSIEGVVLYLKSPVSVAEVAGRSTLLTVVEAVSYIIPNLSALDFSLQAAHGIPVGLADLLFPFGYAVFYCMILLFLATAFLKRREFY